MEEGVHVTKTESKQVGCEVEPPCAVQGEGIKIFVEEGAIRALEEQGAIKALENCASAPVSITDFDFMGKATMQNDSDVQSLKKEKVPKGLSPAQQMKKELYAKLDEILISAMKSEFEVYIGGTVDRLDMVHFLKNVVKQHLCSYPDLEKILALRDTVLTARVKRAFPEVEYKRKQIRLDHFRKAWLYVNIRKKTTSRKKESRGTSLSVQSNHSHTVCWLPQGMVNNMNSVLSPASNHEDQGSESSSDKGDEEEREGSTEDEPVNPFNVHNPKAAFCVNFIQAQERTALVLDNHTVIQWVKSNYVEDHTSYVPVQDVVKAFKNDFNYDISYKECHQMIYSAFTSPRQRSSPLKTVRVSSLGQQYVYRGIAAKQPVKNECSDEATPIDRDHIQEERDDLWKRMVEELKLERDQAVVERNQALTALMEIEKKYADAVERIDQLKKLCSETRRGTNSHDSSLQTKRSISSWLNRPLEQDSEDITGSSCDSHGVNTLQKCVKCQEKEGVIKTYENIKEERDQIWRDIVKQAHQERDEAMRRLETVRRERDLYLERMGKLEMANKQLSINAKKGQTVQDSRAESPRRDITTSVAVNESSTNSKEALSPILAHLRSKRKQAMPSKFNKMPRLGSSKTACGDEIMHDGRISPVIADSGPLSPYTQDIISSSGSRRESEEDKENTLDVDITPAETITEVFDERNSQHENNFHRESNRVLFYTEGSGIVAFRPHPLEE